MRPEFIFADYFRNIKETPFDAYKNRALKTITKHSWPKFRKNEFWKYRTTDYRWCGWVSDSDL